MSKTPVGTLCKFTRASRHDRPTKVTVSLSQLPEPSLALLGKGQTFVLSLQCGRADISPREVKFTVNRAGLTACTASWPLVCPQVGTPVYYVAAVKAQSRFKLSKCPAPNKKHGESVSTIVWTSVKNGSLPLLKDSYLVDVYGTIMVLAYFPATGFYHHGFPLKNVLRWAPLPAAQS